MTILHLDGDKVYAAYLHRALRALETLNNGSHEAAHLLELEFCYAATPTEALEILDTQTIDLVLTELDMLKHNGVEFLQELRSHTDFSRIPVWLLTDVPLERLPSDEVMKEAWDVELRLYKSTLQPDRLFEALVRLPESTNKPA
jgi:CheY-like chemotaxis protein